MIKQTEDIYRGLFEDLKEIDRTKTIKRARALLNQFKQIAHIASCVKPPSISQSFEITTPEFSVGQLISDSTDKNLISRTVEKQTIAQELVEDMVRAINDLYVVKYGQPADYYRSLLYITFIDESVYSRMEAKVKAARTFPNRSNGFMMDDHIFYEDLSVALFAFANSYWSNETQSLLVYKNEEKKE